MICSMTGFGRAQTTFRGIDVAIEIQSVNRRNLELTSSLPREWADIDRELQTAVRGALERGKIHYNVRAMPAGSSAGFHWDEQAMVANFARLRNCADTLGIAWSADAATLVQLAALHRVDSSLPGADEVRADVLSCFQLALDNLLEMRRAEGQALRQDLAARIDLLRGLHARISAAAGGMVDHYRRQLLNRLQNSGLELDCADERVLKEIALFADRCDISEELTRLRSHLDQFSVGLADGSPVGRKLEFILQELLREFNTIGSKAYRIEISQCVIDAKTELERIREQIQNIE